MPITLSRRNKTYQEWRTWLEIHGYPSFITESEAKAVAPTFSWFCDNSLTIHRCPVEDEIGTLEAIKWGFTPDDVRELQAALWWVGAQFGPKVY